MLHRSIHRPPCDMGALADINSVTGNHMREVVIASALLHAGRLLQRKPFKCSGVLSQNGRDQRSVEARKTDADVDEVLLGQILTAEPARIRHARRTPTPAFQLKQPPSR